MRTFFGIVFFLVRSFVKSGFWTWQCSEWPGSSDKEEEDGVEKEEEERRTSRIESEDSKEKQKDLR